VLGSSVDRASVW